MPISEFVCYCFIESMIRVESAYVSGVSECNDLEQDLPIIPPPCKMPQDPQQMSERQSLDPSLAEVSQWAAPFTFLPRSSGECTGRGVDCRVVLVM
jgi:hypothetical protein